MTTAVLILQDTVIKAGTLCSFNETDFVSVDDHNLSLENLFPKESYKDISNQEYQHLKAFAAPKRINKYKQFQRFENLLKNDKVILRKSTSEWTILSRSNENRKIEYRVESTSGTKTIEPSDIKDLSNSSMAKMINRVKGNTSDFSLMRSTGRGLSLRWKSSSHSFEGYPFRGKSTSNSFEDSSVRFVKDIYLHKSTDMKKFAVILPGDKFSVNELVEVTNSDIYGRIKYVLSNSDVTVACISMNYVIEKNLKDIIDQIKFKHEEFSSIMVKMDALVKFNYSVISMEDYPNISRISIKFQESHESEIFRKGDFVKHISGNGTFYAIVKKTWLANNESCLEISWIFPWAKESSNEYFVREADMIKIDDPKSVMKSYEGVIMTPFPILMIEQKEFPNLRISHEFYFILRDSLVELSGHLRWTGYVNGIPVGVLHLVPLDNSLEKYRINETLSKYFADLKYYKSLYLVPLCHLRKNKSKEFRLVIRDLLDNSDPSLNSTLKNAIRMKDESILPLLIENSERQINLEQHPLLLPLLFNRKQFETMEILLNKSKSDETMDLMLLGLALEFLILENRKLFNLSLSKCGNPNRLLKDGETFLTNLLKSNVSKEIIISLLDMDLFDINMANNTGETVFSISCDNLYIDIIRSLVKMIKLSPSIISSARNKVLEKNKADLSNEDKDKIIEIAKLLSSNDANEARLPDCRICFDKPIQIVFTCGHYSCEGCSKQLVDCHMCRKQIQQRHPLFL